MLLLNCAKKVPQLDRAVRQQGWGAKSILQPMGPIHGETVGLFAFGNIAQALADRLKALQMRVIAYDPFAPEMTFAHAGVEPVTMDELARHWMKFSVPVPASSQSSVSKKSTRPSPFMSNRLCDRSALSEQSPDGSASWSK